MADSTYDLKYRLAMIMSSSSWTEKKNIFCHLLSHIRFRFFLQTTVLVFLMSQPALSHCPTGALQLSACTICPGSVTSSDI